MVSARSSLGRLRRAPFAAGLHAGAEKIHVGLERRVEQLVPVQQVGEQRQGLRGELVGAFGMYSYRVSDPRAFFKEISGTREVYTRDQVEEQLRGILMASMASSLGGANVPFLDMAANQALMAQQVKDGLAQAFAHEVLSLSRYRLFHLPTAFGIQVTGTYLRCTSRFRLSSRYCQGKPGRRQP